MSETNELRIAVIGAGPAGVYSSDIFLRQLGKLGEELGLGTKARIEHRPSEGASRAASVFQRLVSAGKRLLRVIEHNEGGANKDLAKFADQINALCDKWDR